MDRGKLGFSMARIEPPKPRSTMEESPGELRIVIPARANPFLLFFIGLWILMMAFGFIMMATDSRVPREQGPPVLMFLPFLLVFGSIAASIFLWNAFGRELILVKDKTLTLRGELLGLGRSREFDLTQVKNLRPAPPSALPEWFASFQRFPGFSAKTILFDYGAKTFRFGSGIDEPEARRIIEAIGRQPR